MRTSSNSTKYNSYKSAGRYTGNGFIPARSTKNDSGGCLGSLLVILLPAIGMGVYFALRVI